MFSYIHYTIQYGINVLKIFYINIFTYCSIFEKLGKSRVPQLLAKAVEPNSNYLPHFLCTTRTKKLDCVYILYSLKFFSVSYLFCGRFWEHIFMYFRPKRTEFTTNTCTTLGNLEDLKFLIESIFFKESHQFQDLHKIILCWLKIWGIDRLYRLSNQKSQINWLENLLI